MERRKRKRRGGDKFGVVLLHAWYSIEDSLGCVMGASSVGALCGGWERR